MAKKTRFIEVEARLRKLALSYPEAYEDFPWGERVVKVKKKVFVFMGMPSADSFGMSTKLPISGGKALMAPFAEPTHYGLGKSGWVTAQFSGDDEIPVPLLEQWIDESYRAVAPKTLVKALPPRGEAPIEPRAPKEAAVPKKAAAPKKASASKKASAPKKAARTTGGKKPSKPKRTAKPSA